MNETQKSYLALHIAVLLYGLTAILGDLISLPAFTLVWWRVLITSFSLLFFVNAVKLYRSLPRRDIINFSLIGTIIAVHWLTFFGAVKLSNVSVCLVCMATASFFTSLIEPLLLEQKFNPYEAGLGLLIIPGMVLIMNDLDASLWLGIPVALLSAFLAALFSVLNKKYVKRATTTEITYLELSSAWLFLTLCLPFFFWQSGTSFAELMPPEQSDWIYLLILALLCTTLAYYLGLYALKELSAFASNLTINLEPVYGILLAIVILNEDEELSQNFYLGTGIILLAVLVYPLIQKRMRKIVEEG